MKAIQYDTPGDEKVLRLADVPAPRLGPRQIRVEVAATAVNRADLLQRRGLYPPPDGESEILGLECAGTVTEIGPEACRCAPGDRVMALLAGGGYAEEVACDEGVAMPVPAGLSLEQAAAIPEAWLTAYLNLFRVAGLHSGETCLVHGGGSGVGTAAIQLCRERGVAVLCTVGSPEKAARCQAMGARHAILYRSEDFAARTLELTAGRGVDAILDCVGAKYLAQNLRALAVDGRLVCIGLLGGARAEIDLGQLLARRLHLVGSTLRTRPVTEKRELCAAFVREILPLFEDRRVAPVVDRVLPLGDAAEAHRLLAASDHFGKVVLQVRRVT
jgi:putative PIG3 family NAD(P)H quinone oxidoreductase